jgi:predicted  nucleic acid-binding Zn-ribbon protein
MKRKLLIVIALIAFTSIGLSSIVHRDNKIEFQKVELQSKQAEIKQLEIDYKTLDKKQNEIQLKSDASKADVEKLQKEKEELLQRQKELEQQVSAKRAADAIAANKLQQAAASVAISAKANAAPLSSNQS